MCGRYTLRTPPAEYWPEEQLDLFVPRYNIAPTQDVPVVRAAGGSASLVMMRWGLIPSWAKDHKMGYRMINARRESVADKPAFRTAFAQRRCLLPADGYYEWTARGKKKQPFYIHRQDDQPFMFAGLWQRWYGPPGQRFDPAWETCTIITGEASDLTADVHDRMPVILAAEDYDRWLDPEFADQDRLKQMLHAQPANDLAIYPVSTLVNKADNDQPECVEPIKMLF